VRPARGGGAENGAEAQLPEDDRGPVCKSAARAQDLELAKVLGTALGQELATPLKRFINPRMA
jgi:hypothetical protein